MVIQYLNKRTIQTNMKIQILIQIRTEMPQICFIRIFSMVGREQVLYLLT